MTSTCLATSRRRSRLPRRAAQAQTSAAYVLLGVCAAAGADLKRPACTQEEKDKAIAAAKARSAEKAKRACPSHHMRGFRVMQAPRLLAAS